MSALSSYYALFLFPFLPWTPYRLRKTLDALVEFWQRLQPLTKDPDTEMPRSILDLVRCMLAS